MLGGNAGLSRTPREAVCLLVEDVLSLTLPPLLHQVMLDPSWVNRRWNVPQEIAAKFRAGCQRKRNEVVVSPRIYFQSKNSYKKHP